MTTLAPHRRSAPFLYAYSMQAVYGTLTTVVLVALLWNLVAMATAREHGWDLLILGVSALAQLAVVTTAATPGPARDRAVDIAHWVFAATMASAALTATHRATLLYVLVLSATMLLTRAHRRRQGRPPCLFESEGGAATFPALGPYDPDAACAVIALVAGYRLAAGN